MKTFDIKGKEDVIHLVVNTCQLADDLLSAFDKFVEKMEKNESFKNGCLRRLKRSLEMKNCIVLKKGKPIQKSKVLRRQIFLAKDSTEGELVNKQVEWYNKS